MNKIFTGFFLCLIFSLSAKSQSPAKSIFFELGGPGIASINYDMRFTSKENGLGFRAGIGYFKVNDDFNTGTSLLTIPLGLNYLLGKDGKNYFEIGAGITYISLSATDQVETSTLKAALVICLSAIVYNLKMGAFSLELLWYLFSIAMASFLTTQECPLVTSFDNIRIPKFLTFVFLFLCNRKNNCHTCYPSSNVSFLN